MSALHCWEDGGDTTCMLVKEHDGPHEFTPDSQITVSLAPDLFDCPMCGLVEHLEIPDDESHCGCNGEGCECECHGGRR